MRTKIEENFIPVIQESFGSGIFEFANNLLNGGPEDMTPTMTGVVLGVIFGYLFQQANGEAGSTDMFKLGFEWGVGLGLGVDVIEYFAGAGLLNLITQSL